MNTPLQDPGIIRIRSSHTALDSMQRLEAALQKRGLTVFATIRFDEDAKQAGLSMPFTRMLVFGNPHAGTPVMIAAPSAALDLPLKALIAEAADGAVWLSCNDPAYLQQRHHIPAQLAKNIGAAETILREVAAG